MNRIRLLALVASVATGVLAQAQTSPDDQFVQVYNLIVQADELRAQGQSKAALDRYIAAQEALRELDRTAPKWNPKVVQFRLNYLNERIVPLQVVERMTPSGTTNTPTFTAQKRPVLQRPASAAANDLQSQLGQAQGTINQLIADKNLLEGKLREALSAQPAATDPRELQKAESRLKELSKENELLKVSIEDTKTKFANVVPATQLEDARQALSEANKKLGGQNETIAAMNSEKTELQKQLRLLLDNDPSKVLKAENEALRRQAAEAKEQTRIAQENKAAVEGLNNRLKELQGDLAAQKARNDALAAEKDVLEKRAKELAAASGQGVNAQLAAKDREIADLQAAVRTHLEKVARLDTELGGLRLEKDSWQKQREGWTKEKAALEQSNVTLQRDKTDLQSKLTTATEALKLAEKRPQVALVDNSKLQEEQRKVRELMKQRDELQQKLKDSEKQLTERAAKKALAEQEKLQREVATLRSRMEALEARKLPYTKEELAMFRQPAQLAANRPDTKAAQKANKRPIVTVAAPAAAPATQMSLSTSDRKPAPAASKPVVVKKTKAWPAGAEPLVVEAQLAFGAHRMDEAEAAYQKVLKLDPTSPNAHANIAVIQMEAGKFTDADGHIAQALQADPEDPYYMSLLGILRFRQGRPDDALDALSRSAQLDPDNAETQNFLGITLSQKGQRVAAEAALRRAIKLQPGNPSAHQNLAVVYATQNPPFLELARWHYQKAREAGLVPNAELEKALGINEAK